MAEERVRRTRRARGRQAARPDIPGGLIFAGLLAGIAAGLLLPLAGPGLVAAVLPVAQGIGTLWLNALQMTIMPLVGSLLFIGIAQASEAAQAGAMARRSLLLFALILFLGAVMSALLTPALLTLMPVPDSAARMLGNVAGGPRAPLPGIGDFIASLVPRNVFSAAAADAMLPIIVFVSLFAVAALGLAPVQRRILRHLFQGIAAAMLTIIGWVLKLAPIGVFAIGLGLTAQGGSGVIAALGHYILIVSLVGLVVLMAAYLLAVTAAKRRLKTFGQAVLPAQALAISTQSSLASLPAMLDSARRLKLRESSAELVLPLAVALFRATGPAMNLAVAIYIAIGSGIDVNSYMLAAGIAVATLTTLGAASLPSSVSYMSSIAPIAVSMGLPVAPLGVLIAVEIVPDIVRTVGNVTMDVAVTTTIDSLRDDPANEEAST